MIRQRMEVQFVIFFLLLGTSMAWSQRLRKPESSSKSDGAPAESKLNPRYADTAPHSYVGVEDDYYPHEHHAGGKAEEYIDSENIKSIKETKEEQGNKNFDESVKDDKYDDHSEHGGHKEFQAGGVSFDKSLKDHKADNKEIENVKQHDIGEKYGGEAVKEHKKGKHKEKSKGHKLHGFKNVYHKEEYGDHKTFHDEFLDSDHLHNYDDHHEHQEMEGGKFSKGYNHEGKNKKFDKGDEKHEWGKADYDSNHEGKHEKGRQSSKHRHTAKKHQGHHQADSHKNKNSVHKIKKGVPPPYVPHTHHGPHQAQIQPYVSHNSHHHAHVPSYHHKSHVHQPQHQTQYDDDHDSYGNEEEHISSHELHKDPYIDHDDHINSDDGHHDGNQYGHYHSQDRDEDHDNVYQERVSQPQQRLVSNVKTVDLNDDKITHRREPVYKQPEPLNHEVQQYRQPVVYVERHKPQEYSKQEKFPHLFNNKYQGQNHRIRYGYEQPRNHHHHHHSHNQRHLPRHPVFEHDHDHHHRREKHHNFPRFSSSDHHHQSHGHHGHKKHFRHTPGIYKEESRPVALAHRNETINTHPVKNEGEHRNSQKQHE